MTITSMNKCIFCLKTDVPFTTKEHIIPESLGNVEDILESYVCDNCQNYLGKEIENFVLSKTPIGFWRTLFGTKNKKGKTPSFNQSQQTSEKGKLANYHPITDNGIIIKPGNLNDELIVEANINDPKLLESINANKKSEIKLVLTPKILIYLGRFLGKIALEYWCKNFGNDIYNNQFDDLRSYVRYGTTSEMWPIFHWTLSIDYAKYYWVSHDMQERVLYSYAFGEIKDTGHILFVFDVGAERYMLIINEKYPDPKKLTIEMLIKLFDDVHEPPDIYFYQSLSHPPKR